VQQKTVQLGQVEFLVLDEADRMLDMGFMPDLKRILALLPTSRQSLLFSATFSEEIRKLADGLLKEPVLVEVARRNSVTETVTHSVYRVPESAKREMLARLVNTLDLQQVLVFVRTRFGANRLAHALVRDGLNATAIHSDRTQAERMEALQDFKDGKVRVLVATDIAARGLDIEQLPCVINFELPHTPEDYVHRIGRTGRAGQTGDAISLVSREEQELLERIEKLLKTTIPERELEGFDPGAAARRHERPERSERSERPGRPERSGEGRPARPASASRPAPASRAPQDPFFEQPYEPGQAAAAKPAATPTPPRPAAPGRPGAVRPVAAVLAPKPGSASTPRG
jgi:ATP-dependent RNA helicase RhlE